MIMQIYGFICNCLKIYRVILFVKSISYAFLNPTASSSKYLYNCLYNYIFGVFSQLNFLSLY